MTTDTIEQTIILADDASPAVGVEYVNEGEGIAIGLGLGHNDIRIVGSLTALSYLSKALAEALEPYR